MQGICNEGVACWEALENVVITTSDPLGMPAHKDEGEKTDASNLAVD